MLPKWNKQLERSDDEFLKNTTTSKDFSNKLEQLRAGRLHAYRTLVVWSGVVLAHIGAALIAVFSFPMDPLPFNNAVRIYFFILLSTLCSMFFLILCLFDYHSIDSKIKTLLLSDISKSK